MAGLDLSTLGLPAFPLARKKPAPVVEPEVDPYDKLTPAQQAMVDKQIELQDQPRGALGEIGAGVMRGVFSEVPKMVGQGLQWFNLPGKGLRDYAEMQNAQYAEDLNPDAHNAVTNAFAQGGAMLAPSLSAMAAVPVALAAGATPMGAMGIAGAAGGALFGASQAQDTYEKAIKAGKTPEEARRLGFKTGAIEGVGETVGTMVGGKFISAVPTLLGKKLTVDAALKTARNPQFLPTLAKDFAKTAAVETSTEMGQNYGEAAVEKAAGIDNTDPWKAATSAVGPVLAMTAFLGPFGAMSLRRQQNQNKNALNTIDRVDSTAAETNAAAAQLAPSIEPLVGKEQFALWRLDRVKNAKWFDEQWNDIGVTQAQQDANQIEADARVAARPTAESVARGYIVNTQPGVLSFADWLKQTPDDGLKLAKGKTTRAGQREAYRLYVDQELAQRGDLASAEQRGVVAPQDQLDLNAEPGSSIPPVEQRPFALEPSPRQGGNIEPVETIPFTPRNDAQGELDLQPVLNRPAGERPSPLWSTQKAEQAATPTAMAQALEAAGVRRGIETQAAYKARLEEVSRSTQQAEAQKARDLAKLAKQPGNQAALELPPVSNPVARAEAERQLAINGNTPITDAGLKNVARVAVTNAGTEYKGQVRKKIEMALSSASGKKMWMQQLVALRKARDAMTENTVSRDAMSAVIDHLTSGTPTLPLPAAQLSQENAHGTPSEVPQGQVGSLFQDPLVNGQGQRNAEAQRNDEGQKQSLLTPAPAAAPGVGEAVSTPLAVESPPVAAPVAKKTQATVQAARAEPRRMSLLAETPQVKVESTGEEVPWGAFSFTAPDGTISYDTPTTAQSKWQLRAKTARAAERARNLAKHYALEEGRNIPVEHQRNVPSSSQFAFEYYNFLPEKGIGNSLNATWTTDFANAVNMAEGKNSAGTRVKFDATEKVQAARDKANATAALEWLKAYDPAEYAAGMERVKQLESIYLRDSVVHAEIERLRKNNKQKHYDAYLAELSDKRGGVVQVSKMSKAEKAAFDAEVDRRTRMDPTLDNLHAELPNYTYSQSLAQELGRGNLDRVLQLLETSAPSEWLRSMAHILRGLSLKSPVRLAGTVARDKDGNRVYGRYHHVNGGISIYLGGENAHTVIHEATHAATVARIAFAKAAEKISWMVRTVEQKAAVASLNELRDLMARIKELNPPSAYAFKNEEEFVAEVLSNDKFQDWLSTQVSQELSLWQRVKNWWNGLFGRTTTEVDSMWEHALRLSIPYLSNSRFAANSALTFEHSVTGAFSQVDLTVGALTKQYERFAADHKFVGQLGEKARSAMLSLSTTFNLAQMIDRVPALRPMVDGVRDFMFADSTKTTMRQNKQLEFSSVLKPLDMLLAKMPRQQAEKMNQRLMQFAGEQSVLNIDLNKNFDENLRRNKELDPELRSYVNQLHAEYMRVDPALRKVLEDSVRVFRKNYIQQTAQTLVGILRTHTESETNISPAVKLLDIQSPDFGKGVNPRPDYYFDAYSADLDKTLRGVFEHLGTEIGEAKSFLGEEVRQVEKLYHLAVANPYQHLGRSGDYFVEFSALPGEVHWQAVQQALASFGKVIGTPNQNRVFMRFEDPARRNAAAAAVKSISEHIEPDTMRAGSLANNDDLYALTKGLPHVAQMLIRRVQAAFPGAQGEELRLFMTKELLNLQPDTSPAKALAQRRGGGIAGYDADFRRSFAKRSIGMSTMLSNAYTMPMYDKAFEKLKDEANRLRNPGSDPNTQDVAQAVVTEFGKRFANSLNPVDSPIIDMMKSGGFNFYLAASPAFVMVNLMQPYHLTLPYLGGRYGFVASAKEMGRSSAKAFGLVQDAVKAGWAAGQAAGGVGGAVHGVLDLTLRLDQSKLSVGEKDMIRALLASGQLDTTQSHELGRLAEGESRTRASVMKGLSAFSHYSEVVNRLTAALTSYNLEVRKEGDSDAKRELASRHAIEAVRATQFDYSDHNTARALGRHGFAGKVTPLLASFQNYSFQVMELMYRMAYDSLRGETAEDRSIARYQLGGVMATTSLIAGTLGLPLASVITRVADAILGSDDEPSDIKTAYRNWLSSVVGKDVGEAIARGIPRAVLGFDTSNRAGLADVLPGSRFFADRRVFKDKVESGALDLLGPAVSAGQDMFVGLGKIADGMLMDGLIQMTPLALRGPIKSVKMGDTGYTTATGNRLPMEVTPWALFVQGVGFTPSVKAEQSEVNFAMRQMEGLLKQRKTVLSNQYFRAAESGEDTTQVLQDVLAFNTQNPQFRIDVGSGMSARAKARAVVDISGTDIATLPRYLPLMERYSYANTK
jgi:hypothetical protein